MKQALVPPEPRPEAFFVLPPYGPLKVGTPGRRIRIEVQRLKRNLNLRRPSPLVPRHPRQPNSIPCPVSVSSSTRLGNQLRIPHRTRRVDLKKNNRCADQNSGSSVHMNRSSPLKKPVPKPSGYKETPSGSESSNSAPILKVALVIDDLQDRPFRRHRPKVRIRLGEFPGRCGQLPRGFVEDAVPC